MTIQWRAPLLGEINQLAAIGASVRTPSTPFLISGSYGTARMNERAGINAVKLAKYMNNSILPLYPDIEDVPGKRVILKVDSGPGRLNVEMLADLRLQGLYLVPGVPNTTHVTQETDQN